MLFSSSRIGPWFGISPDPLFVLPVAVLERLLDSASESKAHCSSRCSRSCASSQPRSLAGAEDTSHREVPATHNRINRQFSTHTSQALNYLTSFSLLLVPWTWPWPSWMMILAHAPVATVYVSLRFGPPRRPRHALSVAQGWPLQFLSRGPFSSLLVYWYCLRHGWRRMLQ